MPLPPWVAVVAAETLTEGWRAAVAGQLSTIAAREVWGRVGRKRRHQFDCAVLADIAESLERAKDWAHDAVAAVARRGLQRLQRLTPEQALAEALAKRIPLPGDEEIDKVVQCLRIAGIYVCVVGDANVLKCPCLLALAKDRSKEKLKAVLEDKLDAAIPPGTGR